MTIEQNIHSDIKNSLFQTTFDTIRKRSFYNRFSLFSYSDKNWQIETEKREAYFLMNQNNIIFQTAYNAVQNTLTKE